MRSNINILQREYGVDAKRAGNSKKLRKSFIIFYASFHGGKKSTRQADF